MVASAHPLCDDVVEWIAFAYAAGRDRRFPIAKGVAELARLGAFGPSPADRAAPLVELIATVRAGVDDGRRFPRALWAEALELVETLKRLVAIKAAGVETAAQTATGAH